MTRFQQYRHSGSLGLGLPLGLLAGAVVGVAGAWLYQRFVIWVPFIYITFLGTLAFGACIGVAVGVAMRAGKTRSLVVPVLVGVLCGALGHAASFKFDYDYRLAQAVEELVAAGEIDPSVGAEELAQAIPFADYLAVRTEQGFSIGRGSDDGLPIQGPLVYLVWLIELALIAGTAAMLARRRLTDTFCERCREWMRSRPLGVHPGVDSDRLRGAVANSDLEALLAPPEHHESAIHAVYSVHECPRCRENPHLTVSLAWVEEDKKGKEETKTEALAHQIRVTPADVAGLEQDLGSGPDAGAAS